MAKTIPAEVPVRLLDVIDEVDLVITRDGQPVARVVPFEKVPQRRTLEQLRGSVTILGDIVGPLDDEWDIER